MRHNRITRRSERTTWSIASPRQNENRRARGAPGSIGKRRPLVLEPPGSWSNRRHPGSPRIPAFLANLLVRRPDRNDAVSSGPRPHPEPRGVANAPLHPHIPAPAPDSSSKSNPALIPRSIRPPQGQGLTWRPQPAETVQGNHRPPFRIGAGIPHPLDNIQGHRVPPVFVHLRSARLGTQFSSAGSFAFLLQHRFQPGQPGLHFLQFAFHRGVVRSGRLGR